MVIHTQPHVSKVFTSSQSMFFPEREARERERVCFPEERESEAALTFGRRILHRGGSDASRAASFVL